MFKRKIKVFFIAQYKAGIDKFESVVREMQKDDKFDVKVLAVPDNINDLFNSKDYEFWYNKFGNITIDSYEGNKWFDLKKLKPDYVFIQRPYDMYVPYEYKKTTLITYTKVCYIPYGYALANIFDITFTLDDMRSMNIVFAEHDEAANYYKKLKEELNDGVTRKIVSLGFPSLDEFKKKVESGVSAFRNIKNKNGINVLWTPRWTTDKTAVETSFFDYKDSIIDCCKGSKNINLVFRPHPLTFNNFIEKELMTEKEVKTYLDKFKGNLYYDNSNSYIDTFKETDVLITDFTSIIPEFFLFNKPIIYTQKDTYKKLKQIEKLEKSFYRVKNQKELNKVLDKLQKGEDSLKEIRKQLIKEIFKDYDGKVSYRIKEYIKEDYKNNFFWK
ncbi:MAG: CDP-glycerol glycerophosphotransferase family protein [Bacilli bacterium]|nr:CDP-glycerol glycerophosphotransferase family protein [Bacilli bacterium]